MMRTYTLIIRATGYPTQHCEESAARAGVFADIAVTPNSATAIDEAVGHAQSEMVWVHDPRIECQWQTTVDRLGEHPTVPMSRPVADVLTLKPGIAMRMWTEHGKIKQGKFPQSPSDEMSLIVARGIWLLAGGMTAGPGTLAGLAARIRDVYPSSDLDDSAGVWCDPDSTPDVAPREPQVSRWVFAPMEQTIDRRLAYVVAHYGTANEARNTCTRYCLEFLTRSQATLPRLIFVHLCIGEEDQYEDIGDLHPCVEYTKIQGWAKHDGVFVKESLFNYAIEHLLGDAACVVFADSDVLPMGSDWLTDTMDKLLAEPDTMCSPYRSWRDQIEGTGQFGIGARATHPDRPFYAPGLAWAFNRQYLDECTAGGELFFCPWCVTGSGDCATLFEHAEPAAYEGQYEYHHDLTWYRDALRSDTFRRLPVDCVPHDLCHYHHGPFKARAYRWSRNFLEPFGDIQQYVELDYDGIAAWRDPTGPVARLTRRKPDLLTDKDTQRAIYEELLLPWTEGGGQRIEIEQDDRHEMLTRRMQRMIK